MTCYTPVKLSQQYQDNVHIHCSQKELSHSYLFLIPTLHSQATADLLSVTIDYFIFLEFCINGIMLYLTIIIFWLCFLEFLPCCCIPFYTESSFSVRIFHNLFIHSAIDGYLSCFLFLVIINKVLWTFVYVFFFMERTFYFSWVSTWEWMYVHIHMEYVRFIFNF